MLHRNAILGLAAMMAAPAAAHHSFDLTFDRDKTVRLTGTVEQFAFAQPHSYFLLAVKTEGATKQWHAESGSANELQAHGWTRASIRPGQVLTVEGWPARNGTPYLRIRSLTTEDGAALKLWLPPGPSPIVNTPG